MLDGDADSDGVADAVSVGRWESEGERTCELDIDIERVALGLLLGLMAWEGEAVATCVADGLPVADEVATCVSDGVEDRL